MKNEDFDESTKSFIKRSLLEQIFYGLNLFILTLLVFSILYPLLNILALSFNDGKDAMRGGIYIWPRVWSLENYKTTFSDDRILNGYKITIARTVIGTSTSVLLTAMAAYVLRTRTLPGKSFLSIFLLITMLFRGGTIPDYLLLKNIKLLNSFWIYILPGLYSAWNIVIMRTFFSSTISYYLEESAKLDGCNDFMVFWRIYMPLSKPVLAVIGLFNGVGHWNDWFSGAYYVTDKNLQPVQTILQEMLTAAQKVQELMQSSGPIHSVQRAVTGESLKMATIVVSTVPIILVYPFIQKYFAKGVMIGAVKE